VGLAPQYAFNPESGLSPWVAAIQFDLPIETAGKRGHRIARAQQLSEAARFHLAAQAWQVRSTLRTAWLDYTVARHRAARLQELIEAQRTSLKLIEGRLAAGAIAAHELTPVRVALLKTQTDLAEARRQTVESRGRVAEAVGLPFRALEGVDLPFDLSLTASGPAAPDFASAEVRRAALHRRADVLAGLAEYAASQSALQLEIARQYPDVHLSTGYEYDQGQNKWGFLGLGAELPVLNRNQGPVAEAEARRTEVAARFLELQAKVIAEIDRALAGRAAAQEQLQQIDALLDTGRQQVRSVEARQQAGAADQLDLRTAQVELHLAELARIEALAKAQQALGQLEDAVQVPFAALKSVENSPRAPAPHEPP
jgi:outer membrane protein TolC